MLNKPGIKDDSGKILAGILGDFAKALESVATVGTYGAAKYVRGGWTSVPDGQQRYTLPCGGTCSSQTTRRLTLRAVFRICITRFGI